MKKNLSKLMILAVGGLMAASTAQAGPLVTQWNFQNDAGFSSFAPSPPAVTPSENNTVLNLPTRLSWGDADFNTPGVQEPQSSFAIVGSGGTGGFGSVAGTVFTNGAPAIGLTVQHKNFPVFGDTLIDATLRDTIVFTPVAPNPPYNGSVSIPGPTVDFAIHFHETTNAEPCTATSPLGNPCNDIFVVDVVGAGFDPNTLSFVTPEFLFEGNLYRGHIFLQGISVLPDAVCQDPVVNQAPGCVGFTTIENQTNDLQASFTLTGRVPEIPEPGMLILFGSGLLGMHWVRRKQNLA